MRLSISLFLNLHIAEDNYKSGLKTMSFFSSQDWLNLNAECFEARRRWDGFLRHKCEVSQCGTTVATLIGGVLSGSGMIVTGDHRYELDRSSMQQGGTVVAQYSIKHRFMRLTVANLHHLETGRAFRFRQERIWSSSLVLLEHETPVGRLRANLVASRYQICAWKEVPLNIVLLSVWVAMVREAFTA